LLPCISYNASKVTGDAVPHSMEDLLKPQFKGRVASTPYVIHFDSLASPELWGEERVLAYATKLSDQLGGLMGCGEHERIASGEFDLFALDCGSFGARRLAAAGAPLDHAIPRDAALLQTNSMGVPRNAAHPATAKLFIDYMLTREAQDYVFEWFYSDHPLLPGSKAATEIEKARADRAQFVSLVVPFFERNESRHLSQVSTEVLRIFQQH
jgi:iron(III) transport system substrate-binding protein